MAVDPRPLYARVEQALLERIHRRYRPGDLLPTQQELAREFGTSLITVKRALDEIARRGLLRSTRGRGTGGRRRPVGGKGAPRARGPRLWGGGAPPRGGPGAGRGGARTRPPPPADTGTASES